MSLRKRHDTGDLCCTGQAASENGSGPLSLKRWIWRGTLWTLLSVLVILALLAGRLMLGPVRVDFLRPVMERAIDGQLDGYSSDFSHTVLVWGGWKRAVDVRVTDLTLKDEHGLAVVTLPQVAVGFHAAALFTGNFLPRTIAIFSPTILLSRHADGSFALRENESAAEGSAEVVRRLLASMLKPPSDDNPLTRLRIEDAVLDIADDAHEEDWRVPDADLEVRRTDAGLVAVLGGVLRGVNRQAAFKLRADYARSLKRVYVVADVNGVQPSMFSRPEGELHMLRGWNLPVSGRASMTASPEGEVDRIDFDLNAAEGQVVVPALAGPLQVDGAVLGGHLDWGSGRLTLRRIQLRVGGGVFAGHGVLFTSPAGEGGSVDATIDGLPFTTLAALWPVAVKTQTRAWIERNVQAGVMSRGTLKLRVDPTAEGKPADTDFDLGFDFAGLEIHYLRPLPPISGGDGRAHLTPHAFELWIDRGHIVDPATDLDLNLKALSAVVDGLDEPGPQVADIVLDVDTDVPQLLTLLDYNPLGYARAFGVKPQDIGGHLRAKGRFRIPLVSHVTLKDVQYNAWALADHFLLRKGFESLEPEPGDVELTLDPSGIVAHGALSFRGQPVDVAWTEAFGAKDGTPTHYTVTASVDAAEMARFGLPDSLQMKGSVLARLDLAGKGTRIDQGKLSLDLAPASFEFGLLQWNKAAGKPGSLEADVATKAGHLLPERFSVSTQGLDAAGTLSFTADGDFEEADVGRLRVGETEAALTVRRSGDGPFDLRIEAPRLDLRPFLAREKDEAQEQEGNPSDFAAVVTLHASEAIAPESVPIDDLDAVLRIEQGELADGEIAGLLRSGKSMAIDYRLDGPDAGIGVWSDDGGELLRTLGVLGGVTGGTLAITGTTAGPPGSRHTVGTLHAQDFRIKDSPMMAQILTLGSLSGLRDLLSGEGIGFDRFDVHYDYGEGSVTLKDGRALGSQLGVRMSGRLYDDRKKLAIEGTLAPAYTLNTVLDYVPVVGAILSGGKNEGLIAIRFSVGGTTDKPDVSVNPLSALTPGFLRGIFDVFSPSEGDGHHHQGDAKAGDGEASEDNGAPAHE